MAKDIYTLDKRIVPAKGIVKIELFDAVTGKKTYEEKGNNFIAPFTIDTIKRCQMFLFATNSPTNYFKTAPSSGLGGSGTGEGIFKWLVLTDASISEDPLSERIIPGNIIGYADRFPYSSTDTKRGTINQNESYAYGDRVHWVFDFATDRANGTIQSICFANDKDPVNSAGYPMTWVGKLVRNYYKMAYGDGYFWGVVNGSSTLYQIDPYDLSEVDTYTLVHTPSSWYDISYHEGYIYHTSNATYGVYKYNLSSRTTVSASVSGCSSSSYSYYGLTTDGTDLYVSIYNGNSTTSYLGRISLATFTSKDVKTIAGYTWVNPFFYFQGNFYGAQLPNGYYYMRQVDYSTGTFTNLASQGMVCPTNSSYIVKDDSEVYITLSISNYYNGVSVGGGVHLYKLNDFLKGSFNLASRKLLASPVIKTNSKTMKVTYDFIFG